jgi:death on curing protein
MPLWISVEAVIAGHDLEIATYGGAAGLRDRDLLAAAVYRARNKHAFGETDIAGLAAAYAFGLASAHAFVDGNKRAAFLAAVAFLRLNGYGFRPSAANAEEKMYALATGKMSEADFAKWLRAGMEHLGSVGSKIQKLEKR